MAKSVYIISIGAILKNSKILFKIPFFPKIEIHAYVRSNILIHIGIMNNKSNED